VLEQLDLRGGSGVVFQNRGQAGLMRSCAIHDCIDAGIVVSDGAAPRLEANEIWGNAEPGVVIWGAGSAPLVQGDRVHDGKDDGIVVSDGAAPDIRGNTIIGNAGLAIWVEDATPTIGPNITDG
jgi:nitrous oxidase accessory protein NosD